eukprot:CAMPEP_0206434480 /NCGR_PEP_ID=MMETSP0324_2-20121206/9194_1 /ASSEMBLY_ACC=CAM_ASM_000836 /TAXON_ID=2866 /ORGANISM="Crypthecodinium cohnii, Strain Seligo" /LENGTH=540 /DNA_ID=CAMNT_0053901025 /DNA_START=57 /DNA_END=1679 /DNA_ORIENTATION=-
MASGFGAHKDGAGERTRTNVFASVCSGQATLLAVPADEELHLSACCTEDAQGEVGALLEFRPHRPHDSDAALGRFAGSVALRLAPTRLRLPGGESPWSLSLQTAASLATPSSSSSSTPNFSVDIAGYCISRLGPALDSLPKPLAQGTKRQLEVQESAKADTPPTATLEAAPAAAPLVSDEPVVRTVRLPSGWAGLSFSEDQNQKLTVSEIPKACFSSAAFQASAGSQVAGVQIGDEIVSINREAPNKIAQRIVTLGDVLNTCKASSKPHKPGDQGKLASPPCVSCDFLRRKKQLGFAVALQMWMRAVKSELPIALGVVTRNPPSAQDEEEKVSATTTAAVAQPPEKRSRQQPAGAPTISKPTTTVKASQPQGPAPTAAAAPRAVYNPLKPAASAAKAADGVQSANSGPKPVLPPVVLHSLPNGLQYEEAKSGSTDSVEARSGQKVEIKFSIFTVEGKKALLERGEIECRIGKNEVLGGWVDGNVDVEEVLASWGQSVVGMRQGGKRRVHIPAGRGFRDRGGDAGKSTPLMFEVDLRKVLT